MKVELSSEKMHKLNQQATAAGFTDVESYVTQLLSAFAEDTSDLPRLTSNELADSLAMIDASVEELENGGGMTLEEARRQSLSKLRKRSSQ